jgi:hypothetical protein
MIDMRNLLQMPVFGKAKNFVFRNARPVDFIRWQYHFENRQPEQFVQILMQYQNPDGGFAYALEADSWNQNSSPIQTWAATELLREINFNDRKHPVVQGILRYLDSENDFVQNKWINTVATNNEYPGASWWNYNPTACLAGFALANAEQSSKLWKKSAMIAKEATDTYLCQNLLNDMHTTLCYIRLMEYCEDGHIHDIFDVNSLKTKLFKQVKSCLTNNTGEWETGYICKPSQFFNSRSSIFYEENKELAEYECEYIIKTQLSDGSWKIPWEWNSFPEEWAISRNWWKSSVCILNMLYLKGMSL